MCTELCRLVLCMDVLCRNPPRSHLLMCKNFRSLSGSSIHGIFWARVLEWVGIPSPMHESEKWKWSRSVVSDWLLATPWTAAYQALLSMGFSRQDYWSGVPFPSPHASLDPLTFPPDEEKATRCGTRVKRHFWALLFPWVSVRPPSPLSIYRGW